MPKQHDGYLVSGVVTRTALRGSSPIRFRWRGSALRRSTSSGGRTPVLLDQPERHDVVVKDGVDLDAATQGAHVVGQRAQVEVLGVLDPGDVGLGHLQHLGKLGLRLADLLPQLGQADRRDDRALARVDLSGGAGALSDFLAQLAGGTVAQRNIFVRSMTIAL